MWRDLRIDKTVTRLIFAVALPAGIQSVITAFSNTFVQAYINYFGSSCMAGWSCYNKLDQVVFLTTQSIAMAATSFVSQNIGAKQEERANRGTIVSMLLAVSTIVVVGGILVLNARYAVMLFTQDESVIAFGVMFIRTNTMFVLFNGVNHVLAGALRGRGDSRGPMSIMLMGFVVLRQIYLFILTRFISNTPRPVGFSYPVGWMLTMVMELGYYIYRRRKAAALS